MNKTPISTQESKTPHGCLILFGIPFAAAGCLLMWLGSIQPLLRHMNSADWEQVPCTIITSEIQEHRDSDGDSTFSNDLSFRYTLAGQQRIGSRINFGAVRSSKRRCVEIQNQFPVGRETECFVDPQNHSESVLLRESGFSIWNFLFSSIFVAVGLCVSVGGFIAYRKNRMTSSVVPGHHSGKSQIEVDSTAPRTANGSKLDEGAFEADAEDRKANIPQRLKAEGSPITRFLVILGVSLFWNGIVSVFVYQLFTERFSIFLALFLTPFILIGIAFCLGVIYMFLALFNPESELALSSGTVPLGGEVDLAWEIKGKTAGIRRLTIELVGTESATYTRGTDTHTDTEDFFRQTIINSENAEEFAFGSSALKIPAETMHTFEASRNRVFWTLQVNADIPWWPDVNEKYPFRVSPAPIE